MAAAVALTGLAALVAGGLRQRLSLFFQQLVQSLLHAAADQFLDLSLDNFLIQLYNFLGHSLLSPFECLCGNFILPEPASYVFFYALFNLRNLLYIIPAFDISTAFSDCRSGKPIPRRENARQFLVSAKWAESRCNIVDRLPMQLRIRRAAPQASARSVSTTPQSAARGTGSPRLPGSCRAKRPTTETA